ncbi:MAG TPA: SGNH hydrolase domain-containing protein [Acidimicrobiales bacterium]|nr:SGNH hydrolase domain-containing protein [Acidimicrobiales bacterium]
MLRYRSKAALARVTGAGVSVCSLVLISAAVSGFSPATSTGTPASMAAPAKLIRPLATVAELPLATVAELPPADCRVLLADTPEFVEAPPRSDQLLPDELNALGSHNLNFGQKSWGVFHTCPPKRVLLIGDSLAFTLGMGLLETEQQYGIELSVAPLLGCGFGDNGELGAPGGFVHNYEECATELASWTKDEARSHPQAIMVEMGWRDSFNWLVNGQIVHLGQADYDAYVEQQMQLLVRELGQKAHVPILFLTVPWAHPAPYPGGVPFPAATPQRHTLINQLLWATSRTFVPGQVRVLNIDRWISPGNRFHAVVDGQQCRFSDNLHLMPFCAELLAPHLLPFVGRMIEDMSSNSASVATSLATVAATAA